MSSWATARNVLAVRLDAAGDVLMTTPALRALRAGAQGRRVTLLTSPAGARAAALVPEVDDVLVHEAPWMKAGGADPERDLALIEELRGKRFDAAVIFTVYSQNPLPAALVCYLASIPLRLARCRENPYHLLTDWVRESEPEQHIRHEVQRQLDLVGSVGCTSDDGRLSLRVPAEARARVDALLEAGGLNRAQPWAVLHPGASAPSRRYAPEQFGAAARGLVDQLGLQLVLTGSEDEVALVEEVRVSVGRPALSLVGALDFAAFAAAIEAAPLLISNNTSAAHLAAAAGTPVVDLYALTNPQHTPWLVPGRVLYHDVPCRNCYRSVCPEGHHHCLALVPPQAVVDAAGDLLRAQSPAWPLDWRRCTALLLDLDGVVLDTEPLHRQAAAQTLEALSALAPEPRDIDLGALYAQHLRGRPRQVGVAALLRAQGIALPQGAPSDAPGFESVWAVANWKAERFRALLATEGALAPLPGVLDLLDEARRRGIRLALVTSSRQARELLAQAGLGERFEAVVDGLTAQREGLEPKPAPDPYRAAAQRLGVRPADCVAIEDSEAGVRSALSAGASVLGVAAERAARRALLRAGAAAVVPGLEALLGEAVAR